MARGRKKATTGVTMLEAYTNELNRLILLETEMVANLNTCREKIEKYKSLILQEQLKELKVLMDEKNITFDDMKTLLENHEPVTEIAE